MIEDDFEPELRALIDAGRDRLGPSPATVKRLRSRIDAAVATSTSVTATSVVTKLVVVAAVATLGTSIYRARGHGVSVPDAPTIADLVLGLDVQPRVRLGVHEDAPPEAPDVSARREVRAAPREALETGEPRDADPPPETVASATPPAALTLAREIELIDRATIALRDGDLAAASAVLSIYDVEAAGRGQLAQEADALEVEVVCRANDPTATARLAAFAQRWPRSPQLSHLTGACAKPAERRQ
jgi:hypothetical protein